MRIETISVKMDIHSNGKHVVVHDYRRFNGDQPAESWSSLYEAGIDENGKVLVATLRQGLIFECAFFTQLYQDRFFNFGGRDLLTAEDVAVFWGEGKGCHVMVFNQVRSQTADGVIDMTSAPGPISGFELYDFRPENEREHRDRNRMREILQEVSTPTCPRSPA